MDDDDAPQREAEYQAARVAYNAALARLVAARKARPKQPPKPSRGNITIDRVWHAYVDRVPQHTGKMQELAEAIAAQFGLSPLYVADIIRNERQRRRSGPPTAEEHDRMTRVREAYERARAQIAAENEWLRANGFIVTGNIGLQ